MLQYELHLILYAFDFAPRTFDLFNMNRRYLGESIAGFYDPATKEFVVVSDDDEVNALELWTHAHEFMHAPQDQHFQLGLITDTPLGYERTQALRALAEGEAELLHNLYIDQGYFGQTELIDIFNLLQPTRRRNVDYVPQVLVDGFLFPYTTGYDFAQTLYNRNGWAGLNAAWQNPPQSTEQIIHPERYLNGDEPQLVTLQPLTDTLGLGWTQITEEEFGEFFLREYLVQRLDAADVEVAATGWGGDRFAVYWHPARDDLVMVLKSLWDSAADRSEFVSAYSAYADAR